MVGGLLVSVAMAVQDQGGGNRSSTVLPASNGMSLNSGLHNVTVPQLKEQFSCANDYSPKVRKPYTITKQRERWTEEEHKKFLEALKLYGRAWRRIEGIIGREVVFLENISFPNPVSLESFCFHYRACRHQDCSSDSSHAQKFFSKVVRDGSGSNTSAVEPIEIPPPRPKRKPMHPYPRKTAHPLNKELSIPEQPLRSLSPNFSISEHENQSPVSVLSAVGSDALGSTDSHTPNCSSSPVSCAGGSHPADFSICEPDSTPENDGSLSPATATAEAHDEQSPKVPKLELFLQENAFSEEVLVEETSTRSLKLFGRTVVVTEYNRPSSPTNGNSKVDTNDGKPVQPLPWNFMATELQPDNGEYNWSHLPQGPPYYLQIQKENSNSMEAGSTTPMPLWGFYGGVPFPFIPFKEQQPRKEHLDSNDEEIPDKEIQKEGSWTGSNSGLVNEGENVDKNTDGETESRQGSCEVKELSRPILELKPSGKTASSDKCMKGFVPYKKQRRAERDSQSSTITGEEKEEQRFRLCL